jgi:squalene-hopene/tetraprenyl-beta-curcumene cyclase
VKHVLQAIDQYLWENHEGLRMQVTHGPVWDTGLTALGLLESELQTEAMDLTIRWFKDRQILDVRGDCHK